MWGKYRVTERNRLNVIAITRSNGHSRFVYLDFEMMIFICLLGRRHRKRDFVPGCRFRKAFPKRAGNIIVRLERQTSALHRKYLQPEVAEMRLARAAHTLDELLTIIHFQQ